jgi:hypothetical protein
LVATWNLWTKSLLKTKHLVNRGGLEPPTR